MSEIISKSAGWCGCCAYWQGEAKLVNGAVYIGKERSVCKQSAHYDDIRAYDHPACGNFKRKW